METEESSAGFDELHAFFRVTHWARHVALGLLVVVLIASAFQFAAALASGRPWPMRAFSPAAYALALIAGSCALLVLVAGPRLLRRFLASGRPADLPVVLKPAGDLDSDSHR
ncbi:MAG: hypothetical protein ACRDHL_12635 [Candidatus Promineifilaceae bacterium]